MFYGQLLFKVIFFLSSSHQHTQGLPSQGPTLTCHHGYTLFIKATLIKKTPWSPQRSSSAENPTAQHQREQTPTMTMGHGSIMLWLPHRSLRPITLACVRACGIYSRFRVSVVGVSAKYCINIFLPSFPIPPCIRRSTPHMTQGVLLVFSI